MSNNTNDDKNKIINELYKIRESLKPSCKKTKLLIRETDKYNNLVKVYNHVSKAIDSIDEVLLLLTKGNNYK